MHFAGNIRVTSVRNANVDRRIDLLEQVSFSHEEYAVLSADSYCDLSSL